MIGNKNGWILLGFSLAMLIVSLLTYSQRGYDIPEVKEQVLFPEVEKRINEIQKVVIAGQGEESTLYLDGFWRVKEKDGYQADFEPLRNLIVGIATLKLSEAKTSLEKNYSFLELQNVDAKDAKSKRIQVFDKSGQVMADFLLGKEGYKLSDLSSSVYVRKSGESQCWLAKGSVSADTKPGNWIMSDVIDLDGREVESMRIQKGSDSVSIRREGDGFALAQSGEMLDKRKAEDAIFPIESLRANDVADKDDKTFTTEPFRVEYKMTDGKTLTLQLWHESGNYWVGFGPWEAIPELEKWVFQVPEYKVNGVTVDAASYRSEETVGEEQIL